MSELDRVNEKVKKDGYVFAKKLPEKYEGKNVYIPYGKMFTGYPILYVVDKNGEISENPELWKDIDIDDFEPEFTKEELAMLLGEGYTLERNHSLENEKWITVHPNVENPDDYRRLKVEDGETSKEAVERKYGKGKGKEEKPQDTESEDKKELGKQGETSRELDKQEETTKEPDFREAIKGYSEEQLAEFERENQDNNMQYYKRKEKYVEEKQKELREREKQLEEDEYKYPMMSEESRKVLDELVNVRAELRESSRKYEDEFDRAHFDELMKLREAQSAVINEKNRRYLEKKEKSEKLADGFRKEIDDLSTAEYTLSDTDFTKRRDELRQKIEGAGLDAYNKFRLLGALNNKVGAVAFERKTKELKSKVENYSKNTEKLVEQLKSFETVASQQEKKREEYHKRSDMLIEKYNKSGSETERQAIEEEMTRDHEAYNREIMYSSEVAVQNAKKVNALLQSVYGDTGAKIETGKVKAGSVAARRFQEISGALNGVLGKDINTKNPPSFSKRKGRAHYDSGKNEIMIGDVYNADTSIHEYMHYLEEHNPKMLENSKAFLEYRTRGETAVSLRRETGKRYDSNEVAKKDSFFEPYCGKIYGFKDSYRLATATELMSMGVERLFTDPKGFAEEDREYFDFVIGNLRGEL